VSWKVNQWQFLSSLHRDRHSFSLFTLKDSSRYPKLHCPGKFHAWLLLSYTLNTLLENTWLETDDVIWFCQLSKKNRSYCPEAKTEHYRFYECFSQIKSIKKLFFCQLHKQTSGKPSLFNFFSKLFPWYLNLGLSKKRRSHFTIKNLKTESLIFKLNCHISR